MFGLKDVDDDFKFVPKSICPYSRDFHPVGVIRRVLNTTGSLIIDHTRDHFYNKWPCLQLVDTQGSTVYQQSEGRLWGQVIGDTAGEKHVHPIEVFAIGWLVMPFEC